MSTITGYHITQIPKGEYGEFSKVREEFMEFTDAMKQSDPLLSLVELSDMVGATDAFMKKHMNIDFNHVVERIDNEDLELPDVGEEERNALLVLTEFFDKMEKEANSKFSNDDLLMQIIQFYYLVEFVTDIHRLKVSHLKLFSDKTVASFVSGKRK